MFTATHGVHFSEDGVKPWAHFKRAVADRVAEDGKTFPVYFFQTDDAAVAKRLTDLGEKGEYGIVAVKEPVEVRPEPGTA